MSEAIMQIDQVGLPAGVPGKARTDGLSTGALVTLTSTGAAQTVLFELLWVPPDDTSALTTFTQISPTQWTFTPTAGVWGSYRIRLTVDKGLGSQRISKHIFGIRAPISNLLVPAANEGSNPLATVTTQTPENIELSENNEPTVNFPSGNAFGWFRFFSEVVQALESGVPTAPGGPAGGDLGLTYPNPRVQGLYGRPMTATAPTSGQVYAWNGTAWAPTNPAGAPTLQSAYNGGQSILTTLANGGITITKGAANGTPASLLKLTDAGSASDQPLIHLDGARTGGTNARILKLTSGTAGSTGISPVEITEGTVTRLDGAAYMQAAGSSFLFQVGPTNANSQVNFSPGNTSYTVSTTFNASATAKTGVLTSRGRAIIDDETATANIASFLKSGVEKLSIFTGGTNGTSDVPVVEIKPTAVANATSGYFGRLGRFRIASPAPSTFSDWFYVNTTPEANVTGSVGDVAVVADTAQVGLWIKDTGTATNTGWAQAMTAARYASNAAPVAITGSNTTQGVSNRYSRQDHNHDGYVIPTANVINTTMGPWYLNNNNFDYRIDTTAGVISINLNAVTQNRWWYVKKINAGTNKITIIPPGGYQINNLGSGVSYDLPGSASASIGFWVVTQNGTDFWITQLGGSGGGSVTYGSPVAAERANADGVSTDVARADHVHDRALLLNSANNTGSFTLQNLDVVSVTPAAALTITLPTASSFGPRSVLVNKRPSGSFLIAVATSGGNTLVGDVAGFLPFSQSTEQVSWMLICDGSTTWRIVPYGNAYAFGTPVTTARANAAGSSGNFARADHVHDSRTRTYSSVLTPAGGGFLAIPTDRDYVLFDNTGHSTTYINFPQASLYGARSFVLVKVPTTGSNNMSSDPVIGDTVIGSWSFGNTNSAMAWECICDGVNTWRIINSVPAIGTPVAIGAANSASGLDGVAAANHVHDGQVPVYSAVSANTTMVTTVGHYGVDAGASGTVTMTMPTGSRDRYWNISKTNAGGGSITLACTSPQSINGLSAGTSLVLPSSAAAGIGAGYLITQIGNTILVG